MINQLEFRALTLWRPWDQAILYGGKRIENRDWSPWKSVIGKYIVIHAGKKYDKEGAYWMEREVLYTPPSPSVSPIGIVGVARVLGSVKESESPWFFGEYGWVLDEVMALESPIVCPGGRGLWRVTGELRNQLLRALRSA